MALAVTAHTAQRGTATSPLTAAELQAFYIPPEKTWRTEVPKNLLIFLVCPLLFLYHLRFLWANALQVEYDWFGSERVTTKASLMFGAFFYGVIYVCVCVCVCVIVR